MRKKKHSYRKITMTHTQTTCPNLITLRSDKKEARPAEVGALSPVFEKSVTELKLKQKLLNCERTIHIVTFNVRILNRIGQLPELTASVIYHNIDIICMQEHRYIHNKDIKYHDTGNGWTFVSASALKNSVNATIGGVGMLIWQQTLKSLNSIEKIQLRMMLATFNGDSSSTIISYCSLNNVNEETDLIAFYNELSSLVRSIRNTKFSSSVEAWMLKLEKH